MAAATLYLPPPTLARRAAPRTSTHPHLNPRPLTCAVRLDMVQDKSEKLELSELKVAVKRALAMAQDVESRISDAQVQVNMWHEHKKQALELAEQTAEYEEEKQRCADMQAAKGESLMEKLGKKSSTIVRARLTTGAPVASVALVSLLWLFAPPTPPVPDGP